MGQRARLKSVKRRVRAAFEGASEAKKAILVERLEAGPLTQEEILAILR